MKKRNLYTSDDIEHSYRRIGEHRRSRHIILRHSYNPADVRSVALEGLPLKRMRTVLDLGCGYGYFTEHLGGLLAADPHIVGIDLVESNREAFLETLDSIGCRGEFHAGNSESIKDMESARFDLVIASYSLYFFPHLIGEIARIAKPGGIFVAITHSRHSLKEIMKFIPDCMERAGIERPDEMALNRLFDAFSLENGGSLLRPHFKQVEMLPFPNYLTFSPAEIDSFIEYLRGKEFLIMKDVLDRFPGKIDEVRDCFYKKIHEKSLQDSGIRVTKDDGIFRCYRY